METDIQGAETVQPAATSGEYRKFIAKGHATSERRRLPRQREGFTQEARIAGQKIFVRTGEYEDGSLGELFIDMHKAGTTMRGMLDAFAVAVSLGLQHGVPLEKYVDAFTFTRFEPAGVVDHPNIKMATSVVDYVFRMIGMEYLGRKDFVQVPPADEELRYYQNKLKQQERKNRTADVKQTATQREMEQSADKPTLPQLAEPKLNSAKVASNGAPICTECGALRSKAGRVTSASTAVRRQVVRKIGFCTGASFRGGAFSYYTSCTTSFHCGDSFRIPRRKMTGELGSVEHKMAEKVAREDCFGHNIMDDVTAGDIKYAYICHSRFTLVV